MEGLSKEKYIEAYKYLYDVYGEELLLWEKDYLNLMIRDYWKTVKK